MGIVEVVVIVLDIDNNGYSGGSGNRSGHR